jgi:hypothetical protein
MPYQSRIRNYRSRREKNEATKRTAQRIVLVALIALAIWIYFNRVRLWDWLETYFY